MLDADIPQEGWWEGVLGRVFANHFSYSVKYIQNLNREPLNPAYCDKKIYTDYATLPFLDGGVMAFDSLTGFIGVGVVEEEDAPYVERYAEAIICHEVFHGEIQKGVGAYGTKHGDKELGRMADEWSEKFDYNPLFDNPTLPPEHPDYLHEFYQCRFSYPDWQNLGLEQLTHLTITPPITA